MLSKQRAGRYANDVFRAFESGAISRKEACWALRNVLFDLSDKQYFKACNFLDQSKFMEEA